MIVLSEPYGNNSNIFFQHVHLDSFCRDNGLLFFNPHLKKYSTLFPGLVLSDNIVVDSGDVFFRLKKLFSKNLDRLADQEARERLLISSGQNVVYVKGWNFRNYKCTSKSREIYKNIFKPVLSEAIKMETENLRKNGKVASLHIRRGDYKKWLNGRYYFDDNFYYSMALKLLKFDPNIGVIQIFSNEPVNSRFFEGLNVDVVLCSGNWVDDQFRMSVCDYIIGPPSTFSLWASYIGSVPIWHFSSKNDNVEFIVSNG